MKRYRLAVDVDIPIADWIDHDRILDEIAERITEQIAGHRTQKRLADKCTVSRPKPRKPKPSADPVDTANLSDAEVHAYYKRTAPATDLAFFLRLNLSAELRTRAESVETPNARIMSGLRMAWRDERNADEHERNIPAIGSEAWRDALLASDALSTEQTA